jgi:predicted AAA+ superfamily ATPase
MIRLCAKKLDEWMKESNRKPMVLRGARQVGKTWLVRDLARRHGRKLVELNFERYPRLARHFEVNDPKLAISNLEAELNLDIPIDGSLLFLDEIQAAPEILAFLRWFQEELPGLPVVAAGSLLEFALEAHNFSMPVGRISYYHLEPMSFNEFLLANGEDKLYNRLIEYQLDNPFNQNLHEKCSALCKQYCLIGGMPAVVNEWITHRDLSKCFKLQQDLLATYHDDFHKYRGRIKPSVLSRILESTSDQTGSKFVFSRVDPSLRAVQLKQALQLLCKARVCHLVLHTAGHGLPLGAEVNERFFKVILLDTGIDAAQLGLSATGIQNTDHLLTADKGAVSEHLVGQMIRAFQAPLQEPRLYYWQRTGGRQGEIDYLFQYGTIPVPVEVKAGAAGSMKSLHQFMAERNLNIAVRCDTNPPSIMTVAVKTTSGKDVSYQLLSIPHYMTENLPRLLAQV